MEKVNTISVDELRSIYSIGHVTIVDIREEELYNEKHLPRAIHIPVQAMERSAFKALPKDHFIVVYGDSNHSADAIDAAKTLDRLGYDNAVLDGGAEAWQNKQLSFEA